MLYGNVNHIRDCDCDSASADSSSYVHTRARAYKVQMLSDQKMTGLRVSTI